MNKKSVISNIIFSILSSSVPLIVLQLIIFPMLSKDLGGDEYGFIITIYSLITILSSAGNALNNVRLLNSQSDKEENKNYNFILEIITFLNVVMIAIGLFFYRPESSMIYYFLTIVVSVLMMIRSYYLVAFCIKINYKYIFINNIYLTFGYLLGCIIYKIYRQWQIILIIGLLFSLIHIWQKSDLMREGIGRKKNVGQITKQFVILLISSLLANVLIYIDKLWLYPILGGTAVSIYYVSTLIGKLISMAISPINSVMLSYVSKMKEINSINLKIATIFTILFGVFCYVFCIMISKPVLEILYPEWANEAINFIYVTTATAIVNAFCSLLSPFLLRFCDLKWQIFISIFGITIYILVTVPMLNFFGLMGFTLGVLITNTVKLLSMALVYVYAKQINIRRIK